MFAIRNAFPSAVALFLLSELAAIVGLSGGAQLRVFSQQILAGNVPGVAQALKIHSRELSQSGLRLVENLVLTCVLYCGISGIHRKGVDVKVVL